MIGLLKVIGNLYSSDYEANFSLFIQKLIEVLSTLIEISHNLALMWTRSASLTSSGDFSLFFFLVSHSSIDRIASAASSLRACLIFLMTVTLMNAGLFLFHALLTFLHLRTPFPIKIIEKLGLFISAKLFFVPFTYSYAMILKYSFNRHETLQEYEENNAGDEFNFGSLGVMISIFLSFLHVFLSAFYVGFDFESRHLSAGIKIEAKSSVKIEVALKLLLFVLSFSYPFLHETNYFVFSSCLVIFFTMNVYYYSLYLPYYSAFMNYFSVLKSLESTSFALFFLLGQIMKNKSIIFILSIFMQPIIILASGHLIKLNSKNVRLRSSKNSYSKFELAHRETLSGNPSESNFIKSANSAFIHTKDRMIRVVQAYFCVDVIKNVQLASIKIYSVPLSRLNILTNFQIYKCTEALKAEGLESCLAVKILKFLSEVREVMEKDKAYCYLMMKLIQKFQEKSTSHKTLENLVKQTNGIVEDLKGKYQELLEEYPESGIILKQYGSFLIDLTGNSKAGRRFLMKSEKYDVKKLFREKNLDVFSDESIGILIFSSSGKIFNANSGLCNFLEIDSEELLKLRVSDILPSHRDFNIQDFLLNFIKSTETHCVQTNQLFFLKNKYGYLKECTISTECVGYNFSVYFVSIIQQNYSNSRYSALIYEDGVIFAHTSNFASLFEFQTNRLEKINIQIIIQEIKVSSLCHDYEIILKKNSKEFLVTFKMIEYEKIRFFLVTCLTDREEIMKLELQKKVKTKEKPLNKRKFSENGISESNFSESYSRKKQMLRANFLDLEEQKKDSRKKKVSSARRTYENSFEYHKIQNVLKIFTVLKCLISILALLICIMTIFLCIQTSKNIEKASPLNPVMILGEIAYDYSELGLYFRLFDLSRKKGLDLNLNISLIETIIKDLEKIKNNLDSAEEYLNFCKDSDIISDDIIPERILPKFQSHKKTNLYKSVLKTNFHAQKLLKNIKEGQSMHTESICFILYESYKITTEMLQKTISQISTCENLRITEMFESSKRNCFIWISSIVFIYVLILIFYLKLNQRLNFIWKMFFKKITISMNSIKGVLVNRLSSTHNFIFYEDFEKVVSKRKKISYNYWARYASVTFILVLVALMIVLLFVYVFGLNIYTSMKYRKNFIEIPLNRRTSIIRMSFNVVQKMSQDFKIEKSCFEVTSFGNFNQEHLLVQNELIRLRSRFYEQDIMNNVPLESWKIIFESFESDQIFIKLGITAAMAYLRFETFLYWTNPGIYSFRNITEYLDDCYQMSLCFSEVLERTDKATWDAISENFKRLIIYGVSSIVFTLGISLALYLAYFKKEVLTIKCIGNTLSYLVLSQENNSRFR